MTKYYDNIVDLCAGVQNCVEQFVYQVEMQVSMMQLRKADLIDRTIKLVGEGEASPLTSDRLVQLIDLSLLTTPTASSKKRKTTPGAPVKTKKKKLLDRRGKGGMIKLDLTPNPVPTTHTHQRDTQPIGGKQHHWTEAGSRLNFVLSVLFQ